MGQNDSCKNGVIILGFSVLSCKPKRLKRSNYMNTKYTSTSPTIGTGTVVKLRVVHVT